MPARRPINNQKAHERVVKQVTLALVKKGDKPVSVNTRKNPGLRGWIKRTPGVTEQRG